MLRIWHPVQQVQSKTIFTVVKQFNEVSTNEALGLLQAKKLRFLSISGQNLTDLISEICYAGMSKTSIVRVRMEYHRRSGFL